MDCWMLCGIIDFRCVNAEEVQGYAEENNTFS